MKFLMILLFLFTSNIEIYSQIGVTFFTRNVQFSSKDTVKVDVRVKDFNDIVAFQFGLRYDTNFLKIHGVELPQPTPIPMSNLGDSMFVELGDTLFFPDCIMGNFGFCKNGEIRIVWDNIIGQWANDSVELFSFYFIAIDSSNLSNVLILDQSILYNIAYFDGLVPTDLFFEYIDNPPQLSSIDDIIDDVVSIFPNPSTGIVNVEYRDNHTISIYNEFGNLIVKDEFLNSYQYNLLRNGFYIIMIDNKLFKILRK